MDKICVSIFTLAHPHPCTHTEAQAHTNTHALTHAVCLSRLGHSSPEEPSKPDQNPYWPAAVLTRSQLRHEKEKEKREPKGLFRHNVIRAVLATGFNAITGMLSCMLDAVKAWRGGAAQAIGVSECSDAVVAFCLKGPEERWSQVRISENKTIQDTEIVSLSLHSLDEILYKMSN